MRGLSALIGVAAALLAASVSDMNETCAARAAQTDAGLAIRPLEQWSCVFGNREIPFHFELDSGPDRRREAGRLQWRHSANQRTISRGESEYRPGATIAVSLRIPPVRDGIIFRTVLTVEFVPDGDNSAAATLEKTLWVFPEDPFADQRETFRGNLLVLDPEDRTFERFEQIELPCKRVSNPAVLDDAEPGTIIVVGEATSLHRHRGLAERLMNRAASGCRVLLLAPADGHIPLPGTDPGRSPDPGELRFRKQQVIHELDKRLDAHAWPDTDGLPGTRVSLRTRPGQVYLEVSSDGDWPWLEVGYPDSGGVFLVCGYSVIEHWEHGPTPRFLLARLLQSRQQRPGTHPIQSVSTGTRQ